MNKRRILVVGSGDYSFRGYILKSLFENNINVVLLKDVKCGWEMEYIEDFIVLNFSNTDYLIDELKKYNKRKKIDAIFTYVEMYVELTSIISQALNLNFYSTQTAICVRDKYMMRTCLEKQGLITPCYRKYDKNLDIINITEDIGFPCVIKPIKGYSSINVIKLQDKYDLLRFNDVLNDSKIKLDWNISNTYLIEEYIDGVEVSVESIVFDDNIVHITVTDKFKDEEPYFEEIGHTLPSILPDEIIKDIYKITSKGIKSLGINNCAVHTEIKLSKKGPVIIEIGGRLAGDKIPYLIKLALGIDMVMGTVMSSLKEKFDFNKNINRFASIAFFIPKKKQIVYKIPIGNPPVNGVVEFEFWGKPGNEVSPPPAQFFTRLGFVIAVGDTYEQSRNSVLETIKWLSLETSLEFAI